MLLQMNYKTMSNLLRGLAQTGAWILLDECNRMTVEVLSVFARQCASVFEALRAGKARFMFEQQETTLVHTIGVIMACNPGYAGRAELPENLKRLLRPFAMVAPDVP